MTKSHTHGFVNYQLTLHCIPNFGVAEPSLNNVESGSISELSGNFFFLLRRHRFRGAEACSLTCGLWQVEMVIASHLGCYTCGSVVEECLLCFRCRSPPRRRREVFSSLDVRSFRADSSANTELMWGRLALNLVALFNSANTG